MTKRELPALSIVEVQDLLRRHEVSPAEVLESLEERINALDDKIGAYLAHDLAAALTEAENADVNLPLGGIPIALKDLINVEGQQCTCASKILGSYRAPYTATVIEKLRAHVYSNRVPATIAQKVPITLPLASKISTAECVVNSSPLAPSSKIDLTFCDPIKTPLEL